MNEKKMLRSAMKKRLQQMTDRTYERLCAKIEANLYEHWKWQSARTIGITLPIGKEINTYPIIRSAWENEKQIAVPKSAPAARNMEFFAITSFAALSKGYAGILEPDPAKATSIKKDEIDLLIVPGMLFDRSGYRIGYGGGYYDRYLQQFSGNTIALAFDFQVIRSLPHETFDIPVQTIITTKGVIECG